MSELIDRSALIKELIDKNIPANRRINDIIMSQPIAYDVDEVVEQLEANGQKMSEAKAISPYSKYSPADHRYYKAISVKKAIDIVRSGGKE